MTEKPNPSAAADKMSEDMKRFFLMIDEWRANEGKVSDFQLAKAYTIHIEPIKFDIIEAIRAKPEAQQTDTLSELRTKIERLLQVQERYSANERPFSAFRRDASCKASALKEVLSLIDSAKADKKERKVDD